MSTVSFLIDVGVETNWIKTKLGTFKQNHCHYRFASGCVSVEAFVEYACREWFSRNWKTMSIEEWELHLLVTSSLAEWERCIVSSFREQPPERDSSPFDVWHDPIHHKPMREVQCRSMLLPWTRRIHRDNVGAFLPLPREPTWNRPWRTIVHRPITIECLCALHHHVAWSPVKVFLLDDRRSLHRCNSVIRGTTWNNCWSVSLWKRVNSDTVDRDDGQLWIVSTETKRNWLESLCCQIERIVH